MRRRSCCCIPMPPFGAAVLAAVILGLALFAVCSGEVVAADWPTYRGDVRRSGSTTETVRAPLQARWVYSAPAAPRMSWSSAEGRVIEGKLIGHQVKYDDAIYPVIVGQRVYFGSSVDHQLHCVDLKSGAELWSFFAGGPIRLAPMVANDRVYFGADDGHAYCLAADDGRLVWKLRAGPSEEWLLARGEMVSRWPVRTGVLVDDGVAFFGAGIFPHEDVFLYAVNAADGSLIWKQDNVSVLDAGRNDLSPQGYLLASDELLFVPSGRTLPGAFDRRTGEFLYKTAHSRTNAGGAIGGFQALLSDEQIYASGPHHFLALEQKTGKIGFGWFAGRQLVVSGAEAYVATGEIVARLNRLNYAINSRLRHECELDVSGAMGKLKGAGADKDQLVKKIDAAQQELKRIANIGIDWQVPTADDSALLAAGNLLFLGGKDHVTAFATETGELAWKSAVEGEARGLAVAADHLFVSTNAGKIYCFASGETELVRPIPSAKPEDAPFPRDKLSDLYAQAAEDILERTGVRSGFCLIAGNEEGRLAWELARRSQLKIYAVESRAENVAAARKALSQTGLYGTRIVVQHADPNAIPYSNYFANLIVSDSCVRTGQLPPAAKQLARHLKPVGGVIALGRPQAAPGEPIDPAAVDEWFRQTELLDQATQQDIDGWALLTRHKLPGAGNWSHQYGNPGNTAVSSDERIKGGLGVLWFGDPGPGDMVNRHEGAVGPLATNGRLFVQGESSILAYDAYNGVFLWKYENPAAIRTGVFKNQNPGNLAAADNALFHFVKDQCFELDAATGQVKRIHRLPREKDDGRYEWGFVATDDGLLFGTATVRKELEARLRRRGRQTEDMTDSLFAIDLATGKHLWTYHGTSIPHHTLAIGPGSVYFIDSSITSEQREQILRQDKTDLTSLIGKDRELAEERAKKADIRNAVALDSRTGETRWVSPVDVTDCSEIGTGGGKLSLMYHDNVLLLGGANANGHYWQQFVSGEFARRRLVALSATDGKKKWAKDANYKHRPIIVGQQVLAEPWSYNLSTGEQKMRTHPLTGEQVPWSLMRTGHHCGMFTGCESGMLLFRSGDTGFYDLKADAGTQHFAGHRLGCWINAIPANGLVMIPEASAGCVCLFSIAATIVMEPRESRREWTIHSAVGAQTPVKSMAVNLGAPGDRKDAQGTVWLSYPRRKAYKETSLDVPLDLQAKFISNEKYSGVSEGSTTILGTDRPWLYTSWAEGIRELTLPLLGPSDASATYRVRLHFARLGSGTEPIEFDVLLQGKTVLENLRLESTIGAPARAVLHEIGGVEVRDKLLIELKPKIGVPVLNAVEVIRTDE